MKTKNTKLTVEILESSTRVCVALNPRLDPLPHAFSLSSSGGEGRGEEATSSSTASALNPIPNRDLDPLAPVIGSNRHFIFNHPNEIHRQNRQD